MKKILSGVLLLAAFVTNAQTKTQYTNPILAGFYPDPSVCRVGADYYLTTSTFAYYPGLPVFHSKDLVNWKQIGNAVNRPEQMDFTGAGVSRGLFAPAITYYKGLFYIVCTLIDKGGNFVITAKDPKGPWSRPAWLKNVDGIDPSLYFDEATDKAYIIYNSIAPNDKPLYEGHRTIRIRTFDYKNLQAGDEEIIIVNGGTDITKKPVWIEAPHIYFVNGWYYLLCAEGGTGYNHSEVVFRSKSVNGPYESYSGNPILTQRHLDPSRKNPITTTGHADLVETPDGKWYAVFLGCRPYQGEHFNTGRETFMAPVHWKDGWPVITEGHDEVAYRYPLPQPHITKKINNGFGGNFSYSTRFTNKGNTLDPRFIFLRTVKENWYHTKSYLKMKLRPEMVSGDANPSFIGFRQSHIKCAATTRLSLKATAENEKAGLVIFQNEHHFYYLCRSIEQGKPVVQLFKSTPTDEMVLLKKAELPISNKSVDLRIVSNGPTYSFYWRDADNKNKTNKEWQLLLDDVDATFLSTKTADGFVGCVFGMYATSLGKPSSTEALFYLFDYRGNDDVLK